MRSQKSFQIFVCSFMILALLVLPFGGQTKTAKASASTSISGYIQDLAPVITKLPGCKKVINSGVSGLFNGIKNIFKGKDTKLKEKMDKATGSGNENVIRVFDSTTAANTGETNKSTKSIDQNQNCLNSIGKAVAKILIDKITLSTIDWIQKGNSGGPLYVQNPVKFFEDIGKSEILGFGLEIKNPDLYPFAKNFMQGVANTYNNKFAMNAQYSLNTLIQKQTPEFSSQTFNLDFTQGGWGAWDAMTQYPQNNPFGFNVMASNELQRRLEGTFQSTAQLAQQTLTQGSGFLGQEMCTKPKGVTREENDKALKERSMNQYKAEEDYTYRLCDKWEYVTPGKLIGDELVSAVQKKDHALLDVSTLNDAVAAILDAVLARFTSSLHSDTGLTGLSVDTSIDNSGNDDFASKHRIEQDFSSSQIAASTWLAEHPDFDIRTDLNQALIDEQRIYIDKLTEQNKELESTVDGKVYSVNSATGQSNAYGLIPTIHQLDYCIPGPHPDWESDAKDSLDRAENKIVDTTGMDFVGVANATRGGGNIGMTITQILSMLGIADTGTIDEWSQIFGTGNAHCGGGNVSISACLSRYYYRGVLDDFAHIGGYLHDDNFQSYELTTGILDRIYDEYVKAIHNVYIPQVLPSVVADNTAEYEKIPEYQDIIKRNKSLIPTMQGIVERLTTIKTKIDNLNTQLAAGTITQDEYEGDTGIKQWIPAFARISSQLVSGDDIAVVDNDLKQLIDEKDHVYKDLLTGPDGCEKTLAAWEADPSLSPMPPQISLAMQNRPDYPMPHLYDYPKTAPVSGFLWYGAYSSFDYWDDGWSSQAENSRRAKNVVDLCNYYQKFGEDTSECNNGTSLMGPNIIYIGDLFTFSSKEARSKIFMDTFEKKLQIY